MQIKKNALKGRGKEKNNMPRTPKVKSITAKLTPEQKKYYDYLMAARDAVMGRVRSYAEDALDCSNADKRGVTTHLSGDFSR